MRLFKCHTGGTLLTLCIVWPRFPATDDIEKALPQLHHPWAASAQARDMTSPCPSSPRDHDVTSRRPRVTDATRRHRHVPVYVCRQSSIWDGVCSKVPQVLSSTLPVTLQVTFCDISARTSFPCAASGRRKGSDGERGRHVWDFQKQMRDGPYHHRDLTTKIVIQRVFFFHH